MRKEVGNVDHGTTVSTHRNLRWRERCFSFFLPFLLLNGRGTLTTVLAVYKEFSLFPYPTKKGTASPFFIYDCYFKLTVHYDVITEMLFHYG